MTVHLTASNNTKKDFFLACKHCWKEDFTAVLGGPQMSKEGVRVDIKTGAGKKYISVEKEIYRLR